MLIKEAVSTQEFSQFPGGTFLMGTDDNIGFPADNEGPATKVSVLPFAMATTTVTNAQFLKFVNQTGYHTDAERLGSSYVFSGLLHETMTGTATPAPTTPWWLSVEGADWKHPFGPQSNVDEILDHPVVHVTLNDARAYCLWATVRLPSEAEWEYAARGTSTGLQYPWGNQLVDSRGFHANTWQGDFPHENTKEDGFLGTAPVNYFEPNSNGLYQMIGNVWEWCSNKAAIPLINFNQDSGADLWKALNSKLVSQETAIRGGSFLCHHCYCNRYRIAARNGETSNSSSSNLGFRVVQDTM